MSCKDVTLTKLRASSKDPDVSLNKKLYPIIAWHWLVPGANSSVLYISKSDLFHNLTRINKYKLNYTFTIFLKV